jgi:anti-sigma regulatory factor (Ser/Thr protein kinase)
VTPDQITLTIPRDRAYYGVAHLVLGGLGIRLNLTIESLEDLQLAIEAVLERAQEQEAVTVAMRVADREIEAMVGPMRGGVRDELEARTDDGVGLRRILEALVDEVALEQSDDGDRVKLTKKVAERAS